MAKNLVESLSGIRGVVGDALTPQRIVNYISAFAHWVDGPQVVVGRDSRPAGNLIESLVISTLRAKGIDVNEIGIAPTPTVQWKTEHLNAAGGIVITASHNPVQWNGLKFISADGVFLNGKEMDEIFRMSREGNFTFESWDNIGQLREIHGVIDEHIESILDLSVVDQEAISKKKFKVVVDAVNGAGSVALPALLEALGCEVYPINCIPNGRFPHEPEPLPENLTQLCDAVKKHDADLGIAVDPDADRCGLVDNTGRYLVEEYTLAIAVDTVLSKMKDTDEPQKVATNLSTTLAIEKVAEKYGAEVFRTPVGEINVVDKMVSTNAVIGGEGNGGVIFPESHLGRDSLVATALVLQRLTDIDMSLHDYFERLPQFRISKNKLPLDDNDPDAVLEKVKELETDASVDTQDGVKLTWSDSWVHLRKSNTEPIIRVYAEAATQEKADTLAQDYIQKISGLMK